MIVERLVVKVGGSLFDWPELPARLSAWLAEQRSVHVLLVPGGGAAADVIRAAHSTFSIGDEAAHWLALRGMTINAHLLAQLLHAPVVAHWRDDRLAILDAYAFCEADEERPGHLPHSWQVTSDSVAARAAHVFEARLILLKSIDIPTGMSWEAAVDKGYVDGHFPRVASGLHVKATNLRTWNKPDLPRRVHSACP